MPRLTDSRCLARLTHFALNTLGEDESFRNAVISSYETSLAEAKRSGRIRTGDDEEKRYNLIITFARLAPLLKARGLEEWFKSKQNLVLNPLMDTPDFVCLVAIWSNWVDVDDTLESAMTDAERGVISEDELLTIGDEVKMLRRFKDEVEAFKRSL